MMILRPSLQPSSRSRSRNAAVHSLCPGAPPEPSNPMTGTGEPSARIAKGQVTAALLNSVMNSRRLIPNLKFLPHWCCERVPRLFDHLVGAGKKRFRKRQSERVCRLEVYDQLEFGRQLNRQVGGVGALENAIGIRCCAAEQIRRIVAERYQASALREVAIAVNRREAASARQIDDELAISQRHGMRRCPARCRPHLEQRGRPTLFRVRAQLLPPRGRNLHWEQRRD